MKTKAFALLFGFAAFVTAASLRASDESDALAVLASDANLEAKAMACDLLGRVGTAEAVPTLAGLLADEKLHDYARDGLERIADPEAGKALLEALKTLEGNLLVGVVITLGDRGDVTAVPALAKIAKGGDSPAANAALSSLGQIATDDAGDAILEGLSEGSAKAKISAAHAALAAAVRMGKEGREDGAKKMRAAVGDASVPAYLKRVAERAGR